MIEFVLSALEFERNEYIYNKAIKTAKDKNKNVLIITPEQYTLSVQKKIISLKDNHAITNIDVVSFERLALKLAGKLGGASSNIITETGKNMIIRKVFKENEEKLRYFVEKAHKRGFINSFKSILSEFEQYNISKESLNVVTSSVKNKRFAQKISDIALIYEAYKKYMEEKYIVREELLLVVNKNLLKSDFLKEYTIILMGFTGFNPIQYKLIETFISNAENVFFSLTHLENENHNIKSADYKSSNLFFMTLETMNKIIDISSKNGKETKKVYLNSVHKNKELEFLKENLFSFSNNVYEEKVENINIVNAYDIYEEVSYVIDKIYHLTRKENIKYKEIAIITSDMENYGDIIFNMFKQNNIPSFIDRRTSAINNVYIEFLRSILQIVKYGYSLNNVFRLLKLYLLDIDYEYLNQMENYCLAVGIDKKKDFVSPFEKLTKKDRIRKKENRKLLFDYERLNDIRSEFIKFIENIEDGLKKSKTVFDKISILKEALFSVIKEENLLEEDLQVITSVNAIFEEIVSLYGNEESDIEEVFDILEAAFEEIDVAFIPPMMDCVVIGDMIRTRLDDIKVTFFLGVNDGKVPSVFKEDEILNTADRYVLNENKLKLAPTNDEKNYIQRFYLYLTLTKASENLYLSYVRKSTKDGILDPAHLINELKELFPHLKTETIEEDKKQKFMLIFKEDKDKKYVESKNEFIDGKIVDLIYKKEIVGSVSSFELFTRCPFSYFIGKSLNIDEREIFEFTIADYGSLVHNILKNIFDELIKNNKLINNLSEKEILEVSKRHTDAVVLEYDILSSVYRNTFLKRKIERVIIRTLKVIRAQIAPSSFRVACIEKEFVSKELLKNGYVLKFRGQIDRIDEAILKNEKYIRIIDYKTGTKEFDLSKTYNGENMQLISYLDAAINLEKANKSATIQPSGIMYYKIDDPFITKEAHKFINKDIFEIEKEIEKNLSMNGCVNSSEKAMYLQQGDNEEKIVKVKSSFNEKKMENLIKHNKNNLIKIGNSIIDGNINISPLADENNELTSCIYCKNQNICGFDETLNFKKVRKFKKLDDESIWEKLEKEYGENDGRKLDE